MGYPFSQNPIRELESIAKTAVVDKNVSFLIGIIENTLEKVIGELKEWIDGNYIKTFI